MTRDALWFQKFGSTESRWCKESMTAEKPKTVIIAPWGPGSEQEVEEREEMKVLPADRPKQNLGFTVTEDRSWVSPKKDLRSAAPP